MNSAQKKKMSEGKTRENFFEAEIRCFFKIDFQFYENPDN